MVTRTKTRSSSSAGDLVVIALLIAMLMSVMKHAEPMLADPCQVLTFVCGSK